MRNLLALVLLGSIWLCCRSDEPRAEPSIQLHELTLDQTTRPVSFSLVLFLVHDFDLRVIDNAGGNDTAKFPDLATAMQATGCVAGCNGGFFSRQPFAPVGGMISGGVRTSRVNLKSWMKGLLVVHEGRPALIETDSIQTSDGFSDLLQSGTWLVRAGQSETDNSRRQIARRTFIGHDGHGRWVIGASSPCTLHELAAALRATEVVAVIDLQTALNFDGGPSTGLWLKQSPDNFYLQELWPVRNYVGIVPKGTP